MEGMAACTRCSLRLIFGYGSSRRSATPTLSARAQAETNAGEAGARPCSTARIRLTETAARRASSFWVQPANLRALATRLPTPVTSSSLTVDPPLSCPFRMPDHPRALHPAVSFVTSLSLPALDRKQDEPSITVVTRSVGEVRTIPEPVAPADRGGETPG